jgi:hypothetical protein
MVFSQPPHVPQILNNIPPRVGDMRGFCRSDSLIAVSELGIEIPKREAQVV